jgi:dipeptide transport system ATP-binding protein
MTPQPLLTASNLTRHYPVSRGLFRPKVLVRALDGVSFTLPAGRTLAVVGESGCGKSTLARQVTMIETPTAGELWLDGIEMTRADAAQRKTARPLVQMVFQNPFASLNPRKRIGTMLEEPLLINTPLSAGEREDRARAMMAKVGLRPEHYRRFPHMFSGGQRQRIAVARALMLNPKVVVADEPVSALDVSIQAQVLNLLMDLQDELGVAYLFIAHNLAVVQHIAHDVLVMYLGKVVESGPKEALFATPRHPYTLALLSSTPSLDPAHRRTKIVLKGELPSPINPPPGCAFHKRCPHAIPRCADEVPLLRTFGTQQVACHRAEELA